MATIIQMLYLSIHFNLQIEIALQDFKGFQFTIKQIDSKVFILLPIIILVLSTQSHLHFVQINLVFIIHLNFSLHLTYFKINAHYLKDFILYFHLIQNSLLEFAILIIL